MRARYFLGIATALGLAGTAAAQTNYGRPVYPTGHGTGRVMYPTPQMPPRGTSGEVTSWRAPGTAPALPPPTITRVSYEEPALPQQSPAKLPLESLPTVPAPTASQPAAAPVVSSPTPSAPVTGPSISMFGASAVPARNANSCAPIAAAREPDCPCAPVPSAWVRAEWLYWVTSGQNLPPLASTAPLGTSLAVAGATSSPASVVLYGGDRNKGNDDFRSGLRVTGGFRLDEAGTWGVEGDFFFLGRSRDNFNTGSSADGFPILTRPFVNALTNEPAASLLSFPGVQSGGIAVETRNTLIGGGVNLTHNLCCRPCSRLDFLAGYRYLGLTDDVAIATEQTTLTGSDPVPAGLRVQLTDNFRTENHFHGGVIGLSGEKKYGFLFAGLRASVALGSVTQITEIGGATTLAAAGTVGSMPNGFLAQPSNIGRYETSRFAVLPEVSVRAGMQVTRHCKAHVGYNYLFLSSAVRAGEQVDERVNLSAVPGVGPSQPAYLGRTTGFWAQGVSAGIQIDF